MNDDEIRAIIYPPAFDEVMALNPDLSDGSALIYSREMPLEMRVRSRETPNQVGVIEKVIFNVFKLEEYGKSLYFKLQLLSDTDLFFHYLLVIGSENYPKIQENNQLDLSLADFGNALLKLLDRFSEDPIQYFAAFIMENDGTGILEFHQNLKYKHVEMLKLELYCADEEAIRKNMAFRFSIVQAKSTHVQAKLRDIGMILRTKNPALFDQLAKTLPDL